MAKSNPHWWPILAAFIISIWISDKDSLWWQRSLIFFGCLIITVCADIIAFKIRHGKFPHEIKDDGSTGI